MAVFRANDRHPADDRILIIRDAMEFELWRQRAQLGIHGIVCRQPFPKEAVKDAAEHLVALSRRRSGNPFNARISIGNPESMDRFFNNDADEDQYFLDQIQQAGIEGPAARIMTTLSYFFKIATGGSAGGQRFWTTAAHINNDTQGWHQHPTAMSCAFTKSGTVFCSGQNKGEGEIYTARAGDVALFGRTVWHKSPDFKENWKRKPRTSVTLLATHDEPTPE